MGLESSVVSRKRKGKQNNRGDTCEPKRREKERRRTGTEVETRRKNGGAIRISTALN